MMELLRSNNLEIEFLQLCSRDHLATACSPRCVLTVVSCGFFIVAGMIMVLLFSLNQCCVYVTSTLRCENHTWEQLLILGMSPNVMDRPMASHNQDQ